MVDWASILAQHGSRVWHTVYRMLDDDADALDCYQETFLAALQVAEPEGIADWPSFLVSSATRRAIDRLRQRYRSRARFVAIASVAEPCGEIDEPSQKAQENELRERVRRAMAELPEKQAEVFWLSCMEGLTHQEIAGRMQLAPGESRVLRQTLRLSAKEYVGRHYVGHYSPAGNHFFAYAVREDLVRWLEPEPPAYRGDKELFKEYLPG